MALIGFEGQIRLEVDKVSFRTKLSKFVHCAPPFFFVPWNVLTFRIPLRFIFFCLSRIVVSTRVPFFELEIFRDFFPRKTYFESEWPNVKSRHFFVEKNWVLFDQKVKNKLVTKNLERKEKFWNVVARKVVWKLILSHFILRIFEK